MPRFLQPVLLCLPVFILGAAAVQSLPLAAQVQHQDAQAVELAFQPPPAYLCLRAATPPVIDGRLDDAAWQSAPWTTDFVDIEGDKKPLPRFRTRAKMLWDEKYFYVAAELEEPHVWATLKDHDSVIFQDNDFEVFIDPDGDNHDYGEFEINALNTGWDLLLPRPYKDGGPAINSWEIPGLRTAVHVQGTLNDPTDADRGWSVELAFPFGVLRELARGKAPPADGAQWRVNFSRVEWRHEIVDGKYRKTPKTKEDNWVWAPQGAIDMHRPENWGYVEFCTDTAAKRVPRADPSAAARHVLHLLYYQQKSYRAKAGRWATSLQELGMPKYTHPMLVGPIVLQTTDSLFEATVGAVAADGSKVRWHIRQDARIWQD